jgi:hypothetical protein
VHLNNDCPCIHSDDTHTHRTRVFLFDLYIQEYEIITNHVFKVKHKLRMRRYQLQSANQE